MVEDDIQFDYSIDVIHRTNTITECKHLSYLIWSRNDLNLKY
jgi:hypothetical protein